MALYVATTEFKCGHYRTRTVGERYLQTNSTLTKRRNDKCPACRKRALETRVKTWHKKMAKTLGRVGL